LSGKPVGRSHLPDERGDVYPEPQEFTKDDFMTRLNDVRDVWMEGLAKIRKALGEDHKDFQNAAICSAAFESLCNMYEIYFMKKEWDDSKMEDFKAHCRTELAIVEKVLPYVAADPEQGWHVEGNFHSFSEELIEKKIAVLKEILA
ncbi:MAG: hypothetical protein J6S58_02095, partial [Lentisphaeria bacterium]|nr:hypothetical protein [Lentisphaeria bacterium]